MSAPSYSGLSGVDNGTPAGFNTAVNSCLVLVRGQQGQKYTSGAAKERGGPGAFCNGKGTRDNALDLDGNDCLPNP